MKNSWRTIKTITDETEKDIEENIAETQFKITGLEYCEEYQVKLFSVNRQGPSEVDIKTFKTKPNPGEFYSCDSIPFYKLTLEPGIADTSLIQ